MTSFKTTLFKAVDSANDWVAGTGAAGFDVEGPVYCDDILVLRMCGGDYDIRASDQEIEVNDSGTANFVDVDGNACFIELRRFSRRPLKASDI